MESHKPDERDGGGIAGGEQPGEPPGGPPEGQEPGEYGSDGYGSDEYGSDEYGSEGYGPDAPAIRIARLSAFSRIVIALALAVAVAAVTVHMGTAFLHVAPENTISVAHEETIEDYVFPEFEQNWKLFAPNPLQQNIHVQVRARLGMPGGENVETGWVDLTEMDHDDIRGNPAPSHTQQNELRRAWDFYGDTHGEDNEPVTNRAQLAEDYVTRIVMRRLGPVLNGGRVERIQLREEVTLVASPPWSAEEIDTTPEYRELPWWLITTADLQEGDRERWEESDQ